jgi:hypothetical protein
LEGLVAGREGRDAARALGETLKHAQTGAELPYVPVHSIGLIEFEPPIFRSSSPVLIDAGMALSIDSALFHGPRGGLRLEDGFSISASGEAVPRFLDYEEWCRSACKRALTGSRADRHGLPNGRAGRVQATHGNALGLAVDMDPRLEACP